MNQCLNCNKETTNPKFCSKSCAAKYNNLKFPKRCKTKVCKNCDKKILSERTYCKHCYSLKKWSWLDKTLKDAQVKKGQPSGKNSKVRSYARNYFKSHNSKNLKCKICGYDNHVEICHIKPISSFSETSLLKEVNHLNNLTCLCPNHHWELDNGILDVEHVRFP